MSETTVVQSPIGPLAVSSRNGCIASIRFDADESAATPGADMCAVLRAAREQLEQYFRGDRREIDLPLDLRGTPFQLGVWGALRAVPYGRTASYGDIARRIGNPAAVRAVGLANGRNPIPIIVPCHRIIGSDGSLTGFGGGLDRKRWLLELEGVLAAEGSIPLPTMSPAAP